MAVLVVAIFCLLMVVELLSRGNAAPEGGNATGRMVTNFGLMLLTSGLGLLIPFSSLLAAAWAQENGIGLFNQVAAPWPVVLLGALLSRTFVSYWLHRAYHAVPLLWRLHRVHHSDTHVDLSLGLRQHPLDYPLRLGAFVAATILFGLPLWAVAMVDLFLLATNLWEHLDARMPERAERMLGLVFATPEIHRIHHSAHQPQTDSNYGGGLIVWDRLFGTYRCPRSEQVERIGLGDEDDRMAPSIGAQLMLPFRTGGPPRVERTQRR